MGETAFKYSFTFVHVFGVIGNILVIISILRQRKLLKNNYYLLILQLAICDLATLVALMGNRVQERASSIHEMYNNKSYCLSLSTVPVFHVTGVYMMLIISVLRYRAAVHPLKPDISRRKLRIVCGLVYIFCWIVGYGEEMPLCFLEKNSFAKNTYFKFSSACEIFLLYAPAAVMAVLYYNTYRSLMTQNKYLKSLGLNPVAQSISGSFFTILKYLENRRTFLVSISTVFCFGVGNLPMSVAIILLIAERSDVLIKHEWIWYLAFVLQAAGSSSVNPLIYGIFDKKLLKFWRICSKRIRGQNN